MTEAVPCTITGFEAFSAHVAASLDNPHTRAMYRKGLEDFVAWWRDRGALPLNRSLVLDHIECLVAARYSPATINQRLSAIRKAVGLGVDSGLLDIATAMDIVRIAGLSRNRVLPGPSLSADEAETLINTPLVSNAKGLRDRALLALIVGCALRGPELVKIQVEDLQKQSGRWTLRNLVGRQGSLRTVVVPPWAKKAVDEWLEIAQLRTGPVFRSVDRSGNVGDRPISPQSVLPIVAAHGKSIGRDIKPKDLRRTCAQLCRQEGGGLEQIQLLLGHASVQTTERYLGARRGVVSAPNGRLRMKWYNRKLAS